MTTLDPALAPTLRQWIDDAVQRQLDARLHALFGDAAEELYGHATGRAGEVPSADPTVADEVRQSVAVYDAEWSSLVDLMAGAFAKLAERAESTCIPDVSLPRAISDDLPASLEELRCQSLSSEQAAASLGVNPSRIRQRLLARTLYGFKDGRSWWVPEFQLAGDRVVPGAEKVFPALSSSVSPVAVARWFVTPWADLVIDEESETVVSPRTWLLEGRDPTPVVAQARVL